MVAYAERLTAQADASEDHCGNVLLAAVDMAEEDVDYTSSLDTLDMAFFECRGKPSALGDGSPARRACWNMAKVVEEMPRDFFLRKVQEVAREYNDPYLATAVVSAHTMQKRRASKWSLTRLDPNEQRELRAICDQGIKLACELDCLLYQDAATHRSDTFLCPPREQYQCEYHGPIVSPPPEVKCEDSRPVPAAAPATAVEADFRNVAKKSP